MSVRLLQDWPARAAQSRPDTAAVVHPEGRMTYGELEGLSDRLARALREVGCRRGDRVALLLPRSPLAIAAVVGILKADCAYVPLDLRSPGPRLARVMERCEPTVLLAAPTTAERLRALARAGGLSAGVRLGWMAREALEGASPGGAGGPREGPAFDLRDVELLPAGTPGWRNGPGDPAYILFTSGSTGEPKGVVITHDNVTAFIRWACSRFAIGPGDRLGGYTELTFDLSTFDVHATFAAGAELHLVPEELKLLPPKVVQLMRRSAMTHWLSVPSFLEQVVRFGCLEKDDLPSMRWVTWCGDVLSTPALRHWMERLPRASFANLYGPTETTVASSCYVVARPLRDPVAPVPIGRACDGEELLVLDEELRPVPSGEPGYLYIRGVGLSPGYWRDSERTREAFLPDPFDEGSGGRLYRTGDLARIDEDGNAHFLGREDQQIKTRGFRVELGEVTAAMLSLPEVETCAVVGFMAKGQPGKLIGCAYVPAGGEPLPPRRGKQRLQGLLPDYMIPVRWKAVDRLPLDDRGKVDRKTIRAWMEEEPWS